MVPLGDVVTTQYGVSTPTATGGDTPIVGMQHIVEGRVLLANLPRTSLTSEELARFRLSDGDVLVNRTNSAVQVGKTGIVVGADGLSAVFASYIVRLNVNTAKAIPEYVNLWMNTATAVRQLRRLATPGVSQYNINANALRTRFFIPLLPLAEQAKIAAFAAHFEDERRTLTATIVAKRRFRRGLIQQLLTGGIRFPQFKMSTRRRHTPLGDLPSEWAEFRLGDLFSERIETARTDLPLLSITGDRGVVVRDNLQRRDTSNGDKSRYLRIAPGDIGYNTMRMWQGVSALSSLEGIVSPAYTVVVPGPDVDGGFAATLFKFPPVINLFRRSSQGLVDDTLSLKFHHFSRIRLCIPPIEEQRAIGGLVAVLDREIELLENLSRLVKRQKHGLLESLLSGELRLPAR